MKRIPQGLALAALLALTCGAASAAGTELKPLSESEMSGVYGRGLSQPTLAAFGMLSTSEQANASAAATAGDLAASIATLSNDGSQTLERQLAQQRLQTAANGMQVTLKLADSLGSANQVLSPMAAMAMLGTMPFGMGFAVPTLPSLPAINNKH